MSSKTVKRWITINGNHIPVYEDGTLGGVAEKFTAYDGTEHEFHAEKATGKTVSELKDDLKKNYGLELDSADADDMQRSKSFNDEKVTMYDKDGNEYEGTYNKYSDGGREIVDIKKKDDDLSAPSFEADLEEYGDPEYKNVTEGVKTERQLERDSDKIKGNWNKAPEPEDKHDAALMKTMDSLQENGKATTDNAEVASQYKLNDNFSVKDNGDGTYDISKKTNEPKTSFGQEFQGKADQYREKFLTNKSDEEIANIKANLDKSTAIVGTTEGDHVAYKAIEDEMSRRKNRSSSSAPSKESARITKGVELARRQLDFDKPGEYAEISDRHWGKSLGISNEKMAEMMSVQDPKYDYEYQKDTETRKAFGSNVTVEHHRMYRVPKESTREVTTKSPVAQAHSMSESELRAYIRSHGLTKQYNMMINNRANASHSNIMSVLRDLVADNIAVDEAKKRKKK